MAQLNQTFTLQPGRNKLNNLGSPITGTGTLVFVVPVRPGGNISAIFQAVGTLGSLATALQVDCSLAAPGTNLATYISSFLGAATGVVAVSSASATPIVGGATYAVSITTGPTSADFYVDID